MNVHCVSVQVIYIQSIKACFRSSHFRSALIDQISVWFVSIECFSLNFRLSRFCSKYFFMLSFKPFPLKNSVQAWSGKYSKRRVIIKIMNHDLGELLSFLGCRDICNERSFDVCHKNGKNIKIIF